MVGLYDVSALVRADQIESWILNGPHVGGFMVRGRMAWLLHCAIRSRCITHARWTVPDPAGEPKPVAAMQLLLWTLMLRLHPKPLIYTPSYEYSVSFAGVAFGVATGLRRAKHLHSTGALLLVLWEQGGALAIVRRLVLGAPQPPDVNIAHRAWRHEPAVADVPHCSHIEAVPVSC